MAHRILDVDRKNIGLGTEGFFFIIPKKHNISKASTPKPQ